MLGKFINISSLSLLGRWGYVVIFVVALLEALPLVGTVVPGHSLVILGGAFSRFGLLNFGLVLFLSFVGAALGDLSGFVLGRRFGYKLISRYGKYFFFNKKRFEQTRKLIKKHPGKTLIIGRFNLFTRALAPFAAGASDVEIKKFMMFNLVGAAFWAGSSVILGYAFGASFEIAAKYFGRIVSVGVIGIILLILAYKFINKNWRVFKKYHAEVLAAGALALYFFSKLAEDVVDGEKITKFDVFLNQKIVGAWGPFWNHLMLALNFITSDPVIALAATALAGFLIYKKKLRALVLMVMSVGGALFWEQLFKALIARARPTDAIALAEGHSFPSGHATVFTVICGLLIYLFTLKIKNRIWRVLFVVGNIFLILLIGLMRLYLGVHWFSDVLGGYALGTLWLCLIILGVRFFTSRKTAKA